MGGLAIIFVLTFGWGVFKFLYECIFKACNEGRTWEEDYKWNEKRRAVKSYFAFVDFLYKEGFVEEGSKTEEKDISYLFYYLAELKYNNEWLSKGYVRKYGYRGTIEKFKNYGEDRNPERYELYLEQLDIIENNYDKDVLLPFLRAFDFAKWHSSYLYVEKYFSNKYKWEALRDEFTEEELARK